MWESVFYSVHQLQRTELLTRGLDNIFTLAIFHAINNLQCQKPIWRGLTFYKKIKHYSEHFQIFKPQYLQNRKIIPKYF